MSHDVVLKLARDTIEVTLLIGGPLLMVSLVVGILVSILQVVTSIHDMTLSLVPRMLAVFLVFLFMLPWAMRILTSFSTELFGHLERFAL